MMLVGVLVLAACLRERAPPCFLYNTSPVMVKRLRTLALKFLIIVFIDAPFFINRGGNCP